MIVYLLILYWVLIIEKISQYKTYVLFKLLYIPSWITDTEWYLSSAISLIGKIRHSLQFPSIILPGVSVWRLEYAEYQNMLTFAEYHSKENASNVSVDNVSIVPFLIFLLKYFIMHIN